MAEYERRNYGPRGGYNNRKRRYRDDDDFDRRPQRRWYEEPLHLKIRKQLLGLAESPLKRTDEEINYLAQTLVDNYFDVDIRTQFLDLVAQMIVEQPLKIPHLAAIVYLINLKKPDLAQEVLEKVAPALQDTLARGAWRQVKLLLRFQACLQSILEGEGVFAILSDLFDRAVDLQTASSEDSLGLELVKIILLTIPYIVASTGDKHNAEVMALLEKTDIVASTPHALEALVNPCPGNDNEGTQQPQPVVKLLQKQLEREAEQGWKLACIPCPWKTATADQRTENTDMAETIENPPKHNLPSTIVPPAVLSEIRPLLPELYTSVYGDQEIETVPPTSDLASSILRDGLVDTINVLDGNRNITAKFLIDVDCFFPAETFVKRGTQFDKLRNVEEGKSTWKPEDVAVDAVFSQLLQLPTPEHKEVYYHSVLTESCKIAPAAIAPSLGRAIRWLYQNVEVMDLELVFRFVDWFSHHLSNFGFTWKWTEWEGDVPLHPAHPRKAFIIAALEKEIRLSFAARIRGTLPDPYQVLITEDKEQDTPPFKYHSDQEPYAEPARQLLQLLKTKAPDSEIAEGPINAIESLAMEQGVTNPLLPSTDAYVTSICYLGSKSLSHMLSQIERCKERLLSIGPRSDPAARLQIISSVMSYWSEKPGVGVNAVDKLLNYTILTPTSVILWALGPDNLGMGDPLMKGYIYEMVASTVGKVTRRVRQIVTARNAPDLPEEQVALLDETLAKEREGMRSLFVLIEDALVGVAEGSVDAMAESAAQDDGVKANLLRSWGRKWLLVFRRWLAVEEAWILETNAVSATAAVVAAAIPTPAAPPATAAPPAADATAATTEMEGVAAASANATANGTSKRRADADEDEEEEADQANGMSRKKARTDEGGPDANDDDIIEMAE